MTRAWISSSSKISLHRRSFLGVVSIGLASWPFCDTFFLWGKALADGGDYTDQNAALLGRSLGTAFAPKKAKAENEAMWDQGLGSFHEKIPLPSGLIDGSGHQLWSAAAFLNVCIRAGLVAQI